METIAHLAKEILCQHGRLTIGRFDKILHCGESWNGCRGCINFNLKTKVMEHFLRYGVKSTSSLNVITFLPDHVFHVSYDHD